VAAELFHAEGRTDRQTDMTKPIISFHNSVNAPKKAENDLFWTRGTKNLVLRQRLRSVQLRPVSGTDQQCGSIQTNDFANQRSSRIEPRPG